MRAMKMLTNLQAAKYENSNVLNNLTCCWVKMFIVLETASNIYIHDLYFEIILRYR